MNRSGRSWRVFISGYKFHIICYYMPSCLFPEILCLILAVKYQMILVQDVTSEPGKYPLSCLYKHSKMATEFNELKLTLTS